MITYKSLLDLGALLLAFILALIVLPFYLIALHPHEFTGLDKSWLLRSAFVLTTLGFAICILTYVVLAVFRLQPLSRFMCWFSFFWVATASFSIPIIKSVEMVDPSITPTSAIGLFGVAVISIAMAAMAVTRFLKYAVIYIGVQLAVALVPVVPEIVNALSPNSTSTASRFMSLSAQRNVLVVSMDDISGALAFEVLERDPTLRARFSDFIFFNGVVGNAPATTMSLTHEMFGARDYPALGGDETEVLEALNRSELVLNDLNVDAMTYGSYNIFNEFPERRVENLAVRPPMNAVSDLYNYVIVRLGTRFAAAFLAELHAGSFDLSMLIGRFFDVTCADCHRLLAEVENHQGPTWDTPEVLTMADFDMLLDSVALGSSDFTLRYMHFTFTHFPVDFDETCTFRGNDAEWYEANQTESGALAETACSLRLFADLLDRLRVIGAYNNTLIVVKSDHGKTTDYFNGPPGTLGFNGNEVWGLDRYRPLLMLKEEGATRDTMMISDRSSALSDLAATLCPRLPSSDNCSAFPGVDLLDQTFDEGAPIPIYVPRNAAATHRFATHERLFLDRGQSLIDLVVAP